MIPKIIHQVWLGPNNIPSRLIKAAKTWQELHPDWDYKLWTEWPSYGYSDGMHPFPAIENFSNTLSSWAQCADMLRLELIRRYGGIYVDMDIVAFKPIDDLIDSCELFVSEEPVVSKEKDIVYVTNALFGATASHPFINYLMRRVQLSSKIAGYKSAHFYGPRLFTSAYNELDNKKDVSILPYELYHSLSVQQVLNADMAISPDAYGVHLYELSWSTDTGVRHYTTLMNDDE